MSIDEAPPVNNSGGMAVRIRRIIMEPKLEWPLIAAEPMSVKGIMIGWAVPLAAIGPVAGLVGSLVFGFGAFGIVYRPSLTLALTGAITSYALSLLSVWVLSLIIDALAPTFQGVKNPVAAMKVAAFSATASWLAGIFQVVPMLAILGIVGLYSLYLLYLGLPLLMKSPPDKAIGYTVVSVIAAAILFAVVGSITSSITTRMASPLLAGTAAGGTVAIAGVGSLDLGKLDAASRSIEAASRQADAGAKGAVTPVAAATLAALVPGSIGGWTRTSLESSSGGAAGVGASSASGHYTQGADTMTLTVSDIGAMGALASIGQALNVQSNKQTEQGYERSGVIDGRMTSAKWDGATRSGEYSTIIGNRFTVAAEGRVSDDHQLKVAVDAIDPGKLAALAAH